MSDLTLPDLAGMVVERHGNQKPWWPRGVPLRAFFAPIFNPARDRHALVVVLAPQDHEEALTRARYLSFLREQFPSMRSVDDTAIGVMHSERYTVSESDFTAMRIVFGGREWT